MLPSVVNDRVFGNENGLVVGVSHNPHADKDTRAKRLKPVAHPHRHLKRAASGIDDRTNPLDPSIKLLIGQKIGPDDSPLSLCHLH